MSDARAEVLARIERALGPRRAPHARHSGVSGSEPQTLRAAADPERFLVRIRGYGGTATEASDVPAAIREAIVRQGIERLAVPGDLPDEWLPAGLETVVDDGLDLDALAALDGALTASACGIDSTGTIVLDGGAGQGRRALTLLPDVHVCVVRRTQLVPDLPDALELLADSIAAGRALTFVSGPSATVDIEFVRVEGVHGPRRLEVILAP